jgi:hypothetical protein
MTVAAIRKVRDREDAIARSRDTRARRDGDYASETHALLHFDFDRQQVIDHIGAAIGIV